MELPKGRVACSASLACMLVRLEPKLLVHIALSLYRLILTVFQGFQPASFSRLPTSTSSRAKTSYCARLSAAHTAARLLDSARLHIVQTATGHAPRLWLCCICGSRWSPEYGTKAVAMQVLHS